MATIQPDPPQPELPLELGARAVADRATFETLARRDDVPGQIGAEECKFLILGVDGATPQLWFLNTNEFAFHHDFVTRGLGVAISLERFNAVTYFREDRSNLAGTIIAHDRFAPVGGETGLYALEFWPTDPVGAPHVALAFELVSAAMRFAAGKIAYHPAGDTQEELLQRDGAELERRGVRSISTRELFADVDYVALNLGEGFGVLSAIDPIQARPPTIRDIALFATLPNDLGHVAGVLSSTPQTPLSHVNLKAKQNDTPNAYVRDGAAHPRIAPLLGQVVRFAVTAEDFELDPAAPEEVEAWLRRIRPANPQTPPRDLSARAIVDLDELRHADVVRVGAKAANLAELRRMLPAGVAPDGYAVPFWFYDRFMAAGRFYDDVRAIVDDDELTTDVAARSDALAELRRRIRKADAPTEIERRLRDVQARFPARVALRCRSSTNNEDLEGFNGAGLYDSYTHRHDEGRLSKTVRQVWASMWNLRAYDERDFHRIDHLTAAMGVLLHPNFDDELANGVAVTKNPYDPRNPGFYVNVQVGESLVTNPDPSATPDELLVSAIGEHGEYETQYIRRSSLAPAGRGVLSAEQIAALVGLLETIQARFAVIYERREDRDFAMDVEFKLDADGGLVVKQARPWVD